MNAAVLGVSLYFFCFYFNTKTCFFFLFFFQIVDNINYFKSNSQALRIVLVLFEILFDHFHKFLFWLSDTLYISVFPIRLKRFHNLGLNFQWLIIQVENIIGHQDNILITWKLEVYVIRLWLYTHKIILLEAQLLWLFKRL